MASPAHRPVKTKRSIKPGLSEQSLPADLVPHPRYGSAPHVSGLTFSEGLIRAGFWRHQREQLFVHSVLVADATKQNYSVFPCEFYVDVLRTCRNCSRPFIFFALEQRHWYETLRFSIDADCVLCSPCRRDARSVRRRLRRYSDLRQKPLRSDRELMFLVDDGAYLIARGVLRNLSTLGQLKNEALKRIPEFRGTSKLVEALTHARAAAT
jgi:Probable zinc-ribbon domain